MQIHPIRKIVRLLPPAQKALKQAEKHLYADGEGGIDKQAADRLFLRDSVDDERREKDQDEIR